MILSCFLGKAQVPLPKVLVQIPGIVLIAFSLIAETAISKKGHKKGIVGHKSEGAALGGPA
jgi:hypothetical protein